MQPERIGRCGVCRCYLDSEDLFCANCGTENPLADTGATQLAHKADHHRFECESCGASMSYDASAQALRCPFCGSSAMSRREGARSVVPEKVVRFEISKGQAERILRDWLGKGFWRPADASKGAAIGEFTGVYVPYWMFEASTKTHWTADSSPAPPGSKGDWYPVAGKNQSHYSGILIAGSSVLTGKETDSIAPFHADAAVSPEQIDLDNAISEEFRVPRKLARPLARAVIEQLERRECSKQVPNRSRKLQVNVRLADLRGFPYLLPVWMLAYRYKENVHRVLINGQSGKIAGSAPFSYGKLGVIGGIVFAVILIAALIAWLAS